jgi:2-isopropylmalate synthase
MGYRLTAEQLNRVFSHFKTLADVKKEVFDEDLESILSEEVFSEVEKYRLVYLNVVSGNVAIPTATMQMTINNELIRDAGFGVGPVDATFAAIRKITGTNYPLLRYTVDAVTKGTDAQGAASVHLKLENRVVVGRGAHPDVIVASAKAYINALNRLEWLKANAREVEVE